MSTINCTEKYDHNIYDIHVWFLLFKKVRVLISHILDHPGLVELDLSHNIIGDRGARAVGKFLNNHSQLVKLNMCDNQIRVPGAQAIAHALTKNTLLQVGLSIVLRCYLQFNMIAPR